jgi:hypothetical protein
LHTHKYISIDMADDDYTDLLNILLEDPTPWDPLLDLHVDEPVATTTTKKRENRRVRVRSTLELKCVVCGDHAEGKLTSLPGIEFLD